jgi:Bacterial toxin 37
MSLLRTERGQTGAEYAGVLLLAALLVAVLFTVVPQIGGTVAHAVECLVPSNDCAAAGTTASGSDAADASATDPAEESRPAAAPTPVAQPTPAPAPGPNVAAAWTGQAANLPTRGSRPFEPKKNERGQPQKKRTDRGYGYEDRHGNIWVWDPTGHAGAHWDVQHPGRSKEHTNVYPDGEVHQGEDNFPNKSRGSDDDGGGSSDNDTAKSVAIGAGAVGAGGLIWWLGKLASPACGPAALVCAVVL